MQDSENCGGASPDLLYPCGVVLEERNESLRCVDGPGCSRKHTLKEEIEPRFPVACESNAIEEPVILVAVLLEIQAQVHQGLLQDAGLVQQQRYQQPADTSVPVKEWMNGLELDVCEGRRCKHRIMPIALVE